MTIKDALFRELRYGLCGAGGALEGLVAPDHVVLDERPEVSATRAEDDYPWLIFRRTTNGEDNQVNYSRARIEMELVGQSTSAEKGDDLLEQINYALRDAFGGKVKTWGKYTANGAADPNGGLRLRCFYMDTVEGVERETKEKWQIVIFIFTFLRA